jgi:PHD/YefM family antitoxin component YafN of YafNO toxin-antitoxin module
MDETTYLLSSKTNAKRLLKAVRDVKSGYKSLIELEWSDEKEAYEPRTSSM